MRRGLFGKLAVQNIRNNRSTYIPYMLTCIFCIAMMYMMEFLRDCPTLEKAVPQDFMFPLLESCFVSQDLEGFFL